MRAGTQGQGVLCGPRARLGAFGAHRVPLCLRGPSGSPVGTSLHAIGVPGLVLGPDLSRWGRHCPWTRAELGLSPESGKDVVRVASRPAHLAVCEREGG